MLAKHDFARALLEFRNAAKAMPHDAEPQYRMGLLFLQIKSLSNAVVAFRKALELNPTHAAAQLKLAELMTASRNKDLVQVAENRLQSMVTASSEDTGASDTLAMAEWQMGRTDDAVRRLEESLRKFPTHLQSSVTLARLELGRSDISGAEKVLRKAVASAPQSTDAAVALGQLYLIFRQPKKADVEFRRAAKLDPQNGLALLGIASIQVAMNHMDEADLTYRQLAALPDKQYKPMHALFLNRLGKREEALAEFEKLAGEEPKDRTARNRVLAAYVDLGKSAEALNLLAFALKKNPQDADALSLRSDLYMRWGRYAEAEKDLKDVLTFLPDSADVQFTLARIYRAQGMLAVERQTLNEALRIDPKHLRSRMALARNLMAGNEAKSALDVLGEATDAQKKELGVVIARNWALMMMGNDKEAQTAIAAWLPRTRNRELLLQDALIKMTDHDYAGARTSAEGVLQQVPGDVRAARLVADSYAGQQQIPLALGRLKSIAAANPRSAPMQHLLGQWLMGTGDTVGALRAFEAAKAADPKFWAADVNIAQIDRREGRIEAARKRLAAVIAGDARNVPALLMAAEIQTTLGDEAGAVALYRRVVDADGGNLLALNNLAYRVALENPDEALKYAQQAAEIAPGNPAVQDTLAFVYYRKGVYHQAVIYLKSAVAKEATPKREFHLGKSYVKSGEMDLGERTMKVALQKDPNLVKSEVGW